ncbi:hypothetical protein OE88DRAFT_1103513 [Heliocybe sulcata]|uniref:Uncharacterized protein n=1 Tax=Heliocybe sulcata TaxID=5364 RepID=A0A5C3MLN5_9AGAM|nr:hypothetical protein OE88DRAFT_1103513 [Heliocybe sulcata]
MQDSYTQGRGFVIRICGWVSGPLALPVLLVLAVLQIISPKHLQVLGEFDILLFRTWEPELICSDLRKL